MSLDADFYSKLVTNIQRVQEYENRALQEKALAHIPVSELVRNAQLAVLDSASRKRSGSEKTDPGFRDFLLVELLHWFKHSFFSWVDTLNCSRCGGPTTVTGTVEPTAEDRVGLASRVELHGCAKCQTAERFPRYNLPEKLLETRRGRCGEWANCFTLFARTLGYDARYVLDWTDHVWTEVYSVTQKRWLHCDPCEALCDAPLVYEAGWGKQLSCIIAFSKDEVQDVTWRYTSDFEAVRARRGFPEAELVEILLVSTQQCQVTCSRERREELLLRRVRELAEFLTPREATPAERQGRTSGSLQWRQLRGEAGSWAPFAHKPASCQCRTILFKYSSAMDKYSIWEDGVETGQLAGWSKGAFGIENMFRKEEQDWKMSYLARREDAPEGSISWRFDLSPGRTVEKVDLRIPGATFENGCVRWYLSSDEDSLPLDGVTGVHSLMPRKKLKFLCLKATVTGGQGANAWQHAQLCRESLNDQQYSLEVSLTFSD